jgi:hypothetical protein
VSILKGYFIDRNKKTNIKSNMNVLFLKSKDRGNQNLNLMAKILLSDTDQRV